MSTTTPDISTPTLAEHLEGGAEMPARGVSIGRFLVLGSLGMGGMGMVLSAYDPQLERKVALKLLRGDVWRGARSDVAHEQLVREAQAMARLSHPNVVAVYEVVFGEPTGYLVMELVEGTTLRAWMEEKKRHWRDIVDTLIAAGAGLAAAHRAGLVHHDFKPENVLVDKEGRPRVSDFGVAGVGTPGAGTKAYMAPEQLAAKVVDARADQFAFCVTLWEALHGERPSPGAVPPPARKAPQWVYRALARGLRVAPEDRWPSLDALLLALRRGRSTGVRLAAVAAAIVVVGAAAFVVGRQASSAPSCGGAEARLAGVWDGARKEAARAAFAATGLPYSAKAWSGASARIDEYTRGWVAMHTEACRATRVEGRQSDTLLDLRMACLERRRDLLGALSDMWARGVNAAAVERAIDAAGALPPLAECADARALAERVPAPRDQALAARVAAARRSVDSARVLLFVGRPADAMKAAAAARVEAEATGWPQARAEATFVEGSILHARQDPGAEPLLLDSARFAYQAHDDALAARALVRLARAIAETQRNASRALLVADIADGAVTRAGGDEELRIDILLARGHAHSAAEQNAAARTQFTAVRDRAIAAFGPQHHMVIRMLGELAELATKEGDYAGARALAEKGLEGVIAINGPDHPRVASWLSNLGEIVTNLGDHENAARLFRRSLEIKEKAGLGETVLMANSLNGLAVVEDELGHFQEAEALMKRALAIDERVLGPEHDSVVMTLLNLGTNQRLQGRYGAALALLERAQALATKAHGPEHPMVALDLSEIGWAHDNQGEPAAALGHFRRALQIREKALGPDHEDTHRARAQMAWALAALHRCAEARPLVATAVPGLEKPRPNDKGVLYALIARGRCDLAEGKPDEAIVALERAVGVAGKDGLPVYRGLARSSLARALWARGDRRSALAAARQAQTELAGSAEGARELAAIGAWLAAHGR